MKSALAVTITLLVAVAASGAGLQTTRVSIAGDGSQLGGDSTAPAISRDGRFVAFTFNNSLLGLHDNLTGQTAAIGATTSGSSFTSDGRYLIYVSSSLGSSAAYDVTTGATQALGVTAYSVSDDLHYAAYTISDGFSRVSYVRDLQTGQEVQVPAPPSTFGTWNDVATPVLSASGRYVAYVHVSAPPGYLGRTYHTYIWDRIGGQLGEIAEGTPRTFSRDERSLLIAPVTAGVGLVYDLTAGSGTSLAQVTTGTLSEMSSNGRFIAIVDQRSSVYHAYLLDRSTGQAPQADVSSDGASGNASASAAASDDNGRIVYASYATNLVAGDTNGTSDIFLTAGSGAVQVPGPPTSLRSTVTPSGSGTGLVTLSWLAPSLGGAPTTYVIEAGSAPGLVDLANFSTNSVATTYSTSAGPGTYFVRVRGSNAGGTGQASNEVVVNVTSTVPALPGPPANLRASVDGSTVYLAWDPPTYGGAPAGYVVRAGSRSYATDLAYFSTGSTATAYTATNVGPGMYFVSVQAFNAGGTSVPSNEVVVTVSTSQPCTAAPGAPTWLSAQVSGSTVVLDWQPGAGLPTSYIVEAGSAPTLADLADFDTGSPATTLTVVNVAPRTYYVRVRAKNACGVSGPSMETTAVVR